MPELPEVETIRRSLEPCLAGLSITGINPLYPSALLPDAGMFSQVLPGLEIRRLCRRGKYLIVDLSGDWSLVIHLRMTGKLLWKPAPQPPALHTHVILSLSDGSELHFQDVRRFGRWRLVETAELCRVPGLCTLGPEPIDGDFSPQVFNAQLARRQKGKLKALLLDQTVVAGLGNIYVDEALFLAGLHPLRTAGSLSPEETAALAGACRQALDTGIRHRGTTLRDYLDGREQQGDMQNFLQVFGREGEPCPRCGAEIRRIRVAGRSSYFCPACQPEKAISGKGKSD